MTIIPTNKKKIINDPVYGFIKIPFDSAFDIIEHPYFQRLRRIKQLGLTNYVYPGATHTRFQHALGAAHLMWLAIEVLRIKGHEITSQEAEAALIAILLHDIGHGPFSHALENSIIEGIRHEDLSRLIMNRLNREMGSRLDLAVAIFNDKHHKRFLNQLVSSQLDVDRMDYLRRDSFFTGVTEGTIGSDRIIKMLTVVNDRLVVESKGIYSIEKFLIARRLMYWQVYLHKAVLAAEIMLVRILRRAKALAADGTELFADPHLRYFLANRVGKDDFAETDLGKAIDHFMNLDDYNLLTAIKVWMDHDDKILSTLCTQIINRRLFRILISDQPIAEERTGKIRDIACRHYGIRQADVHYFVSTGVISNHAYSSEDERIQILYQRGILKDVADASDMLDLSVLSKVVKKYYLCYPKELESINQT